MSQDERLSGGDTEITDFLKRIQAGDEGAARELLQRFEAEVRLVVRRQLPRLLRSRFDSLDFLQSVWGSFFRRMRTSPTEFEDSRHLVAFLARAAKNKVIDEYRRAASHKNNMHREEPLWADGNRPREVAGSNDTPSEVAEAHEALVRMRELVPEEKRSILELKAEGYSSKDIGERLGISERTVQRVLEELRRRMETEWESPELIGPPAGGPGKRQPRPPQSSWPENMSKPGVIRTGPEGGRICNGTSADPVTRATARARAWRCCAPTWRCAGRPARS
jgi:RNA polymerase sigma factor (sigma-70 family)